jgi:hypothetical protein
VSGIGVLADYRYDLPMRRLPRVAPVVTAGWPDLVEELDRWSKAGQVATLWWRDDDAVAPSAKLDRALATAENVPIALAVIPAEVQPGLAAWLCGSARSIVGTRAVVLQHGWRHLNHSAGGKKSEFPPERLYQDVAFDLAAGRARLTELFGTSALPVLVPPWNRFDDRFLALLPGCGISAISRTKPRRVQSPIPGLIESNVHVDLVAWAAGRGFIGEEAALSGVVGHLRARRLGIACTDEPTGILTHHNIQDTATEAFLRRLVEVTEAHVAVRWLDATEVFAPTTVSVA